MHTYIHIHTYRHKHTHKHTNTHTHKHTPRAWPGWSTHASPDCPFAAPCALKRALVAVLSTDPFAHCSRSIANGIGVDDGIIGVDDGILSVDDGIIGLDDGIAIVTPPSAELRCVADAIVPHVELRFHAQAT